LFLLNLPSHTVRTAHGTSLYVFKDSIVEEVPFDGGPARQLVTTADAGFDNGTIVDLALDDASAYVRAYTGLLAVPIDGGPVEWTLLGGSAPGRIAVSQDSVYVSAEGPIYRFGKDGSASDATLATGQNYAFDIVATPDGGKVFWLDEPRMVLADGGTGTLWVYDGSVRVLAQNLPFPFAVAIDDADVYWADGMTGAIYRLPLDANLNTPVETVAQIPSQPQVEQFALDETHVYWFAQDGSSPSYLYKRAKCGGPITTLTSGVSQPWGIAVTDDSVYWGGNAIYRVAK
jgi:hypothetical protein